MKPTNENLLPCPFHSKPLSGHGVAIYGGVAKSYVYCCWCYAQGPEANTDKEAIKRWNKRSNAEKEK